MVPEGLININYALHTCVHMGTVLNAFDTMKEPHTISYPFKHSRGGNGSLHTLVMVDMDHGTGPHLQWLVANIPGIRVDQGQVIASYQSPAPRPGPGGHKLVMAVMEQPHLIGFQDLSSYAVESPCSDLGRTGFDIDRFRSQHGLGEIFAANYFNVVYDERVTPEMMQLCNAQPTVSRQ